MQYSIPDVTLVFLELFPGTDSTISPPFISVLSASEGASANTNIAWSKNHFYYRLARYSGRMDKRSVPFQEVRIAYQVVCVKIYRMYFFVNVREWASGWKTSIDKRFLDSVANIIQSYLLYKCPWSHFSVVYQPYLSSIHPIDFSIECTKAARQITRIDTATSRF
jgi:hypothetical protein